MRKVVVSNRSVYHKYAEVEVEVPNNVAEENIEQWLYDNSEQYDSQLDQKISEAEYVFGTGLYDFAGMEDAESDSETRYDVMNKIIDNIEVSYTQVYGGHL